MKPPDWLKIAPLRTRLTNSGPVLDVQVEVAREFTGGRPEFIIIERAHKAFHSERRLWKFQVLTASGAVLDYSFCSTRGMAWSMAKRSWRRAEREHRRRWSDASVSLSASNGEDR